MVKGYLEELREQIAKKFDAALAVKSEPVDPQQAFKQKADKLIQEALKACSSRD
jgi:hypothetical protein